MICYILPLFLMAPAFAEEKKDEKKPQPPKVMLASPAIIGAGAPAVVRLRGSGLDEAMAVCLVDGPAGVVLTLKNKGRSEPPKPFDANRGGDTHVEVELNLPADAPPGGVSLIVVTAAGESNVFPLAVADAKTLASEKADNGGFKTAQEISPGQSIIGAVEKDQDVDVYRVAGKKGDVLRAEVVAGRYSSLLDPILTFHDSRGHALLTSDDSAFGRDCVVRLVLPADGEFFLSIIDAHDKGSVFHSYCLRVNLNP